MATNHNDHHHNGHQNNDHHHNDHTTTTTTTNHPCHHDQRHLLNPSHGPGLLHGHHVCTDATVGQLYVYVDTVDDILGYRELAQMIIEVEKVMFWKKHLKHKHFLHKLDYFAVSDEEVDKKAIKIALIKKQVVRNYDEVKRLDRITKEINQAQVQEKVEKFAR